MIFLKTGLPRNGKTLHTIQQVMELKKLSDKLHAQDPSKHPLREVYYYGIPGIKVPGWILIESMEALQKWYELPTGSIIVIDECQEIFRPRANGSAVPPYISKFETHGHRAHDVFLITQHPMLIDGNIRRLAGCHMHVKRTFGAESSIIHEWSSVKENCDKTTKDSIKHVWKYPKEIYELYTSAAGHTVKRSIPKKVIALLLLPILIIGAVYMAVTLFSKMIDKSGKNEALTASAAASVASTDAANRPPQKLDWMAQQKPRIEGLPHTAPAYDDLTKPQQVPAPQACVVMRDKCKCYTNQATPISTPDDLCRSIVQNGIYLPHLPPAQATQDELQRRYDAQGVQQEQT